MKILNYQFIGFVFLNFCLSTNLSSYFTCDFDGGVNPFDGAQDIGVHGTDGKIDALSDTNFTISGYVNNEYELELNQGDIDCTFLFKEISGDFEIIVRIPQLIFIGDSSQANISAGLLVAKSLTTTDEYFSSYINLYCDGDSTYEREFRCAYKNGLGYAKFKPLISCNGLMPWVAVKREGDTFSGSYSLDGSTWHQMFLRLTTGDFGDRAYVGLFEANLKISGEASGFAEFDNLSI